MTPHEPNLPEKLQDAVRHVVCDGVLVVGEYELSAGDEGEVWIAHRSGEGGEFSAEALHTAIKRFYVEHF